MRIDITTAISRERLEQAFHLQNDKLVGHIGTHFDVMDKAFPLEYTERRGIAFDVSGVGDREIAVSDIDIDTIERDTFVAFYTGYIERVGYGEDGYFANHPQLSTNLIDTLLERGVSIIGIDCGGIRRGSEHTPIDQYCADHGVFVVENLCHLDELIRQGGHFTAHTYPMNWAGVTGLPCRVIAEV